MFYLNLDISPFQHTIKSYSVHGMKGSTDPPAVTDGVFTVKIQYGTQLIGDQR